MDEASLKRPVGSPQQMADQLRCLLRAAARPKLTVQVLPFTAGTHPMMGGSLTLLTLRDGGTMASIESFSSGETAELPKRTLDLTQRFDVARSLALPVEKSLALICDYLKGYEDKRDS